MRRYRSGLAQAGSRSLAVGPQASRAGVSGTNARACFASLEADRSAPLSSRGLGRRPLMAETRVRIPVAVLAAPRCLRGVSRSQGVAWWECPGLGTAGTDRRVAYPLVSAASAPSARRSSTLQQCSTGYRAATHAAAAGRARGRSGSDETAWCPATWLEFAPKFDTFWIMDSVGIVGRQV